MNKFFKKYSILCVLIVISVKVEAQPKYRSAKIEEPDVKQGGSSPDAISSRFHDLGGVISQLFSGFNQGRREGMPGLNSPTNSQFYPGVPAQNGFTRPPLGQGNNWPFPNQGNIQGNNNYKGIRHQQLDQSNQNVLNSNNNLHSPEHQRRKQPGHHYNSNYQTNPEEQSIHNQGTQYAGQSKTAPWPSLGSMVNNGHNEGTLDDFFPTEGPTGFGDQYGNNDHRIIFPDHYNVDVETTSKNAIWGKQVRVPTTTPPGNILFIDSSETTDQKQCVQNCPTSSEYNPVCGTDGVTYFNPGRLICARNCGINVFETRQGQCRG